MVRNIDIDHLANVTIAFLKEKNLQPNDLTGSARGSIWGQLCVKFFGKSCKGFVDSMYIYTAWKRDKNGFRTNVKANFSDNSLCETQINLTQEEKNDIIRNFIGYSNNGRKRLSNKFSDFVSSKLQKAGLKCWLSCKYNWFRKEKSRKSGDFWSGKYFCIECKMEVSLSVRSSDQTYILAKYSKIKEHDKLVEKNINKRIIGAEREKIGTEINSKGITNFRAENYLKKSNLNLVFFKFYFKYFIKAEFIDYSIIRKISSEYRHRYKIFNEVRIDADAIKNSFDTIVTETKPKGIKGFVQDIAVNPFRMVLTSEIQVLVF
jgi:hypothetical protein